MTFDHNNAPIRYTESLMLASARWLMPEAVEARSHAPAEVETGMPQDAEVVATLSGWPRIFPGL